MGIWAHQNTPRVTGSAQPFTEYSGRSSTLPSGARTADHASEQGRKKGAVDGRRQEGQRQE
eukprot:14628918-Heterocapsa_arctica.AAC.1